MQTNTVALDMAGDWAGALAPPPQMSPSQYAAHAIVLPAGANARAGPFRPFKFQADLMDMIAAPDVREAILMTSAQVAKTSAMIGLLAYYSTIDPSPILFVSPSDAANHAFVVERLKPLASASPKWAATFDKKGQTNDLWTFPSGFVAFASSYRPEALASRAVKICMVDELDRCAMSAGGEGPPLALAKRRLTTYPDSKLIVSSTPTTRLNSRIANEYERSDKRLWHIACPECGSVAPLSFDRLVWAEGKPETARLACHDCEHKMTERVRLDVIAQGEWLSTTNGELGVIGFHANALISPFLSLEQVAREREAAKTQEQLRTFTNLMIGTPFDEGAEVRLDSLSLRDKAEPVTIPYPRDIQFFSAGCDVQGNRLELTILAHLPRNQRLVIEHVVIPGDTSGDVPWQTLDSILGRPLQLSDGRQLPIAITGVDSGFQTSRVAQFVASQRAKLRRVLALKGVATWGAPAIREGSRIARGLTRNYLVGTSDVKTSVTKALALDRDAPHAIRLSDALTDEYYAGLASEHLQATVKKTGHVQMQWIKDPSVKNESLDCICYAVAVASLVRSLPTATNQTAPTKPTISSAAARLRAAVNS